MIVAARRGNRTTSLDNEAPGDFPTRRIGPSLARLNRVR